MADAWAEVELEALVEEIDAVSVGGDAHQVEEALFDVDDLIAAAVWSDQKAVVAHVARRVAALIRQLPDAFAQVAQTAQEMVKSRAVAKHLDVYDFWLAVCEAEQWADSEVGEA